MLLAQGGLLALSLILLDEVDNAYGDVYSASVCSHSLMPTVSIRHWGVGIGIASTLLATVLPMQALDMAAWGAGGRLDGLILSNSLAEIVNFG